MSSREAPRPDRCRQLVDDVRSTWQVTGSILMPPSAHPIGQSLHSYTRSTHASDRKQPHCCRGHVDKGAENNGCPLEARPGQAQPCKNNALVCLTGRSSPTRNRAVPRMMSNPYQAKLRVFREECATAANAHFQSSGPSCPVGRHNRTCSLPQEARGQSTEDGSQSGSGELDQFHRGIQACHAGEAVFVPPNKERKRNATWHFEPKSAFARSGSADHERRQPEKRLDERHHHGTAKRIPKRE